MGPASGLLVRSAPVESGKPEPSEYSSLTLETTRSSQSVISRETLLAEVRCPIRAPSSAGELRDMSPPLKRAG
jgi:hypothetical protein